MTRSLASKLCDARGAALAMALAIAMAMTAGLTSSCGAPRGEVAVARALVPSADAGVRRPDGVALELPTAMPSAAARAEARGTVALRQPVSGDAVRALVRATMDAWQHESLEGLFSLLGTDASALDSHARGRAGVVDGFRQRMHARDYRKLEGIELYRPDRVEHYAWDELGGPDAPSRPPDMRPDDVYVRVPLEVWQLGGEKYFEGVIVLLIRLEAGKLKIVGYGETGGS